MKYDTQKKAVRLFNLVVAGFVMLLIFGTQTWADDGCEKMTIEAEVFAVTSNPLGQYAGTALLTIDGLSYYADVVVNPKGCPSSPRTARSTWR